MAKYLTDLHTHTSLSPCAEDDMNMDNILEIAKVQKIRILGITDHNSTLNAQIFKNNVDENSIFILTGAEVSTIENIHCLCFVDGQKKLNKLQYFLEKNIKQIPNKTDIYGNQYIFDDKGKINTTLSNFLLTQVQVDIWELQKFIDSLDGIFIPAHIDRPRYSLLSQLKEFPKNLNYTALGISRNSKPNELHELLTNSNIDLNNQRFFRNSDAHSLEDVGLFPTYLELNKITFQEIKKSLNNVNNITLFKEMNYNYSKEDIDYG